MIDGLLAFLVAGLALASLFSRVSQVLLTEDESVRFRAADTLGVALVLVGTLSLMLRRRAPLAVLGVSSVAFFGYQALGYAPPPLPFAALIALYTVAVRCSLVVSTSAAGAMIIGVIVAALTDHSPLTDDQFLAYLFSAVTAVMLGYGVQLSRAHTSLLEEQTARLARERAAETELAVQKEQARIARELHDIVAHNVSVIVAQAGAAQCVFDAEPKYARQALGSIEATGREALIEMRRLLRVVQPDHIERTPQPGLRQLPTLVKQVGRAGLPVQLAICGDPRPLPAGVELSAYRIVQEALTNTLKHAGPTRASVVVGYDTGFLRLQIRDEGRGATPDTPPGHGLVGMRQRAALLGGKLSAGPRPDIGFQVTAELPVNGERP